MTTIVPAILEESLQDIGRRLNDIVGAAGVVQLDVVDGKLAPARSWPHTHGGAEEFREIISGQKGLPHWEDFDFEVDLMVADAVPEVREWIGAGASRIIIHAESSDSHAAMTMLQDSRHAENFPIRVGIAVRAMDTPSILKPFDGQFDYIQVMGIARIGVQGSSFDVRALELISSLRQAYPDMPIQVDGGVRVDNAKDIVAAGATTLVAGSAIFAEGDPQENIEALKKAAR